MSEIVLRGQYSNESGRIGSGKWVALKGLRMGYSCGLILES
jgi:hypothetical protein